MSRATTRKLIKKRKIECSDCKYFVGNRKIADHGRCSKGLDTTCYRQSKIKCVGWEFILEI